MLIGNFNNFNGGVVIRFLGIFFLSLGVMVIGVILYNLYLIKIYIIEYDGVVDFLWYLFNFVLIFNVIVGIYYVYFNYFILMLE